MLKSIKIYDIIPLVSGGESGGKDSSHTPPLDGRDCTVEKAAECDQSFSTLETI